MNPPVHCSVEWIQAGHLWLVCLFTGWSIVCCKLSIVRKVIPLLQPPNGNGTNLLSIGYCHFSQWSVLSLFCSHRLNQSRSIVRLQPLAHHGHRQFESCRCVLPNSTVLFVRLIALANCARLCQGWHWICPWRAICLLALPRLGESFNLALLSDILQIFASICSLPVSDCLLQPLSAVPYH